MDRLLVENNFLEEEEKAKKIIAEQALVEDEPSHGSSSPVDIATTLPKAGFAKATLSRTLPAMVGYVQELNGPVGYVFGFRPKGTSGSTNAGNGTHVTNSNTPDNIEYQGTNGEVGPGAVSPGATTISVTNPLSNETSEDFMITRKKVQTGLREVKIDMTNEVEQDVISLFGAHFKELYYDFMDPGRTATLSRVAWFFFEYATTQMVKKTNTAFVNYLKNVGTDVGIAAGIDNVDKVIFALGEMQAKLYGAPRKKVAGRTWVIAAPEVASILSTTSEVLGDGFGEKQEDRYPRSAENTFVATIGNMDVYSSSDLANGEVIMGIIGNANTSSIYYCPYNEYMINSGADAYTGISNIFFRVRDTWVTNPLDTFDNTQPVAEQIGDNGYPPVDVDEDATLNNSDYIIKGTLTIPTVFA